MSGVPWKRCNKCGQHYLYAGACFACAATPTKAIHFHRVLEGDVADWVAVGWIDSGTRNGFGLNDVEALIEWHGEQPQIPEYAREHGPACTCMTCVKKRASERAGGSR